MDIFSVRFNINLSSFVNSVQRFEQITKNWINPRMFKKKEGFCQTYNLYFAVLPWIGSGKT